MINSKHQIRKKMVLSGNSFEVFVKDEIKTLTPALSIFKANYTFIDKGRNAGRETDLLLIKPYGIFLLECKNYSSKKNNLAYISGEEYEADWYFRSSGKRGTVLNPVMLNKRRVRCIQGLFRKYKYPVYNISSFIVVPDSCTIYSKCPYVKSISQLVNYLISLDKKFCPSMKSNEESELQIKCSSIFDAIHYKSRKIKD